MTKKYEPAPMLNIGVSKETVNEARAAVEKILEHKHLDPTVLVQALQTFEKLCAVEHVNISHCTFTGATK